MVEASYTLQGLRSEGKLEDGSGDGVQRLGRKKWVRKAYADRGGLDQCVLGIRIVSPTVRRGLFQSWEGGLHLGRATGGLFSGVRKEG